MSDSNNTLSLPPSYKKRPRYSSSAPQSSCRMVAPPPPPPPPAPLLALPPPPPYGDRGAPVIDVMASIDALLSRLQSEAVDALVQEHSSPVSSPTAAPPPPPPPSFCWTITRPSYVTVGELMAHTAINADAGRQARERLMESNVVPPIAHERLVRRHEPYGGMSQVQVVPKGLNFVDRVQCIFYDEVPYVNVLLRRSHDEAPPHLKLGGVLMELSPNTIAGLVGLLTGVAISLVEMFHQHQGRCAIRIGGLGVPPVAGSAEDAPAVAANHLELVADQLAHVVKKLNQKLWMGPTFALHANTDAAGLALEEYVNTIRENTRFDTRCARFPRHLVTVEKWLPREQMRRRPYLPAGAPPPPPPVTPEW